MKLSLHNKLFILLVTPILLCLGVGIIVTSIKLKENGENALTAKSKAILTRMETVRTFIAKQNEIEGLIEQMTEKYPNGNLPEREHEKSLKKCQ